MAEAEERHAQRWEKKLRDLGAEPPVFKDTIARRLESLVEQICRSRDRHSPHGATEERQEAQFHDDQAQRALAGEQDVEEFLRQSALEEKAHARALSAMAPPAGPRTALDKILKRERWHGRGGSWVADAIYGANDGLGAVFGVVSRRSRRDEQPAALHSDLRPCGNACFHALNGCRGVSRSKATRSSSTSTIDSVEQAVLLANQVTDDALVVI